jgi:hypothetical protein
MDHADEFTQTCSKHIDATSWLSGPKFALTSAAPKTILNILNILMSCTVVLQIFNPI